MTYVKDFKWERGMSAAGLAEALGSVGFQSIELDRASKTIIKMKETGAKIFLTFTSNMVTSGLRGFFAQLTELRLPDVIVTTVGSIEEDIMRSMGEQFIIGDFNVDDFGLYEEGTNRVGNLFIKNKSYEKFENKMSKMLSELYARKKNWPGA